MTEKGIIKMLAGALALFIMLVFALLGWLNEHAMRPILFTFSYWMVALVVILICIKKVK